MGKLKVTVSNRLQDRMLGRAVRVQIERTPNPFQRKQWIRATATIKAATFTEKAVVETELYFLPFMDAVRSAQARWPGKAVSYTTLAVTAAQKEKIEAAPAEKAE